jgi:tetratricopeptide (TPR) repeat protein
VKILAVFILHSYFFFYSSNYIYIYIKGRYDEALKHYEYVLSISHSGSSFITIKDAVLFLRMGDIYYGISKYTEAKDSYLHSISIWKTCHGLLGIGACCLRLGSFVDAEEVLCEANTHNPHDPYVWGYLTLLYSLTSHADQASFSLKEALRMSFCDLTLLSEISQQLVLIGSLVEAENAGMRALAFAEDKFHNTSPEVIRAISKQSSGKIMSVTVQRFHQLLSELRKIRRIMGDLYFSTDNKEKAIELYSSVVNGPIPTDAAGKTLVAHCNNQLAICHNKSK